MRILQVALVILLVGSRAGAAPAYPLRVAADHRHVVDRDGQAVFFNAESAWHLLMRLTREEAIQYLDAARDSGFDALVVMLVVATGSHGTSDNAYGEPPFLERGDFSTPNEAYFAHADWVLRQAADRGFTVFLAPAYLGYQCGGQGWCRQMKRCGVAKMREWGRYVGTRYRNQPNIVWLDGGDCDAADYGALDVVDTVAYGIKDVDPEHLHAAHCSRYHSAGDCYDRPWLDINTTYADCSQTPRKLQLDDARQPRRPYFYIEGRYEAEKDWSPACLRSQAYWSLLGGAVGHCFGNGKIWGFFPGWQEALASDGAVSMSLFRNLLHSRDWASLAPDYVHAVLVGGHDSLDSPDYAAAARTADGRTVLAYAPTARTLTVAMNAIVGPAAEAWWYDPARGESIGIGTFPTTGRRDFVPPRDGDWVLVLDAAEAGLGPPGVLANLHGR
jgi:hypothetical protein